MNVCSLVAYIAAYYYIRSMIESDAAQVVIVCGLGAFLAATSRA